MDFSSLLDKAERNAKKVSKDLTVTESELASQKSKELKRIEQVPWNLKLWN